MYSHWIDARRQQEGSTDDGDALTGQGLDDVVYYVKDRYPSELEFKACHLNLKYVVNIFLAN